MDKLKERYEIIIGFVALIVSLSAFKDELTKIDIDIGFYILSASNYLFGLIICLLFTLHLYLITYVFSSTRIANLKIFSFLESITYFLFVFLAVSPFFVFVLVIINYIVNIFKELPPTTKGPLNYAFTFIVGVISAILSNYLSSKYKNQKYADEKEELENKEIKEFENTQKLFKDGYYSQAILEAFKVLESHFKRLIIQHDIPFRSNKIQDIIEVANKLKLLSRDEIGIINNIRKMRNSAAHMDVDFTKSQAEEAILFIKELILRTAINKNGT